MGYHVHRRPYLQKERTDYFGLSVNWKKLCDLSLVPRRRQASGIWTLCQKQGRKFGAFRLTTRVRLMSENQPVLPIATFVLPARHRSLSHAEMPRWYQLLPLLMHLRLILRCHQRYCSPSLLKALRKAKLYFMSENGTNNYVLAFADVSFTGERSPIRKIATLGKGRLVDCLFCPLFGS